MRIFRLVSRLGLRLVTGIGFVVIGGSQANYDARDFRAAEPAAGTSVERRRLTVDAFLASPAAALGTRIVANRFGLPKTMFREGRPLTVPSTLDAETIARNFLKANRTLFPLAA